MKSLIVSLHDVHPGSLAPVIEQRESLHSWGVPCCSLLMVPRFHHEKKLTDSPEIIAWGTQAQLRGDELVLHGYYHDRQGQNESLDTVFWTRFYSNREAEFFDLHEMKARERIERGKVLFQQLGWIPHGFIAPAWLMEGHVSETLGQLGFRYTNVLTGIIPLTPKPLWKPARSLCWSVRAGWRRSLSLAWNAALFQRLLGGTIVRVSLHPRDFDFVAVKRQIENVIKRALDAGFQPVTYATYVAN